VRAELFISGTKVTSAPDTTRFLSINKGALRLDLAAGIQEKIFKPTGEASGGEERYRFSPAFNAGWDLLTY
jgi:hypothetical protein